MDGFDLFSLDASSDIEAILNIIDGLVSMEDGSMSVQESGKSGGVTLEELQQKDFNEPQMNEISIGISAGLPVEIYAKDCYNWKQMREIRQGLAEGLDTAIYENPLFTVEQMREIRRGLIDGVEAREYARLIMAATDMRRERHRLVAQAYLKKPNGYARLICDEDTGLQIRISDDYMEAYLTIPREVDRQFTSGEIEKFLKKYEVNTGLMKDNIHILAASDVRDNEIQVAQGDLPQKGRDGWYDLRFDPGLPEAPKVLPDGRVDYLHVKVAESVEPGQELAKYHPAEKGKKGKTVTGIAVEAEGGKELPLLTGTGFHKGSKQDVYLASVKGFVTYNPDNYRLDVWNVYVVDGDVNRYNGNLVYDGTIYIKGSVGDTAHIRARGDIVVDGYVEAATLEAGRNILIRGGVNGGGKGKMIAEGKVMGNFFETATVKAKGTVEGNYFLNSHVETEDKVIARGKQSRILGGRTVAMVGIESLAVGNYGKSKTYLEVGEIHQIDKRLQECSKQREKTESEVALLEEGRLKLRKVFGNEEIENNSIFHKTCIALSQKEEELRQLESETERLEAVRKRALRCYLKVTGTIAPDVVVRINGKTVQLKQGAGVYLTAGNRE